MEILKKIGVSIAFITICSFTIAQQVDTNSIIQAFQKSYVNEDSKDLASAITNLKQLNSEDSYEINLRLGWLTYSSGLFTESMRYYTQAIQLKPFAIEPKFGLIYPASKLEQWNIVIQEYNKILEIAPSNTTALYQLGLIYYNRKNFIVAEKYFEKVVNLFPFDYDGLTMLGWSKFHLKKYREAKILFVKALMNNPEGTSAKEGFQLLEK